MHRSLSWGLALLFHSAFASRLELGSRGANCCKFTLASKAPFPCEAGQLEDGQIRLNGSYPTTEFCFDKQSGSFTDDSGFGCIVTDPPTTQVQCDEGKPPVTGFSISADSTFLYNGSPTFYACPATDTEYNIYVSPNFGQAKCFPIELEAKGGCGASTTTSCPATTLPPVTSWQTQWVTETMNVTSTVTKWKSCTSKTTTPIGSTGGNHTLTGCHRCTNTKTSSSTWEPSTFATRTTSMA